MKFFLIVVAIIVIVIIIDTLNVIVYDRFHVYLSGVEELLFACIIFLSVIIYNMRKDIQALKDSVAELQQKAD